MPSSPRCRPPSTLPIQVLDYHEHAIGAGAEARAAAYIEMRVGDRACCIGVGIDADIVAASFKAICCAARRVPAHCGVSIAEATMAD